MTEPTKACNLTKNEIEYLIGMHGCNLCNPEENNTRIERINYLYKRLKAFDEQTPSKIVKEDEASKGWK